MSTCFRTFSRVTSTAAEFYSGGISEIRTVASGMASASLAEGFLRGSLEAGC